MITKKELTYRGKTIEELEKLDVREFAKYLKSRPRRHVLRQFQNIEEFVNRSKIKISKGKQVKTHQRDLVVVPNMVGMKIQIYKGNKFVPVEITIEMLGHKLGEFAPTRTRVQHSGGKLNSTKGAKPKIKK